MSEFTTVITRDDLRKKYEEALQAQKKKERDFVERAVDDIQYGVLQANERGETNYKRMFMCHECKKREVIEEIRDRVADIFVDSVVTLQEHESMAYHKGTYLSVVVQWDHDASSAGNT
jgi:c-di-AMP phosphodiesterase-like protein